MFSAVHISDARSNNLPGFISTTRTIYHHDHQFTSQSMNHGTIPAFHFQSLQTTSTKMGASFRSYVWDPLLLISQIISMQSTFYVCFGLWLIIVDYILGRPKSLEQIFGYSCLEFNSSGGRMIAAVYVMNALTCAVGLWLIVQRTKQCTDFAVTVHFGHFMACWMYNASIPSSVGWWLTNIGCIALTTVLGEYLCMRSELRDIPLSGVRADL